MTEQQKTLYTAFGTIMRYAEQRATTKEKQRMTSLLGRASAVVFLNKCLEVLTGHMTIEDVGGRWPDGKFHEAINYIYNNRTSTLMKEKIPYEGQALVLIETTGRA